jgi:hypothetical protein
MSTVKDDLTRRDTVEEVRVVDLPDWLVALTAAGGLPVDEDGGNLHHDSVWAEWWDEGVTVWKAGPNLPTDQIGLSPMDL